MLGRTYALGHETDLEDALLARPIRKVCDPASPWAIWYPLRRSGAFEHLSAAEQRVILAEHGGIGHAYGRAGYGTDIRLACFGLDTNDNDFASAGPELYPLSSIVQRMRTKQTSTYLTGSALLHRQAVCGGRPYNTASSPSYGGRRLPMSRLTRRHPRPAHTAGTYR